MDKTMVDVTKLDSCYKTIPDVVYGASNYCRERQQSELWICFICQSMHVDERAGMNHFMLTHGSILPEEFQTITETHGGEDWLTNDMCVDSDESPLTIIEGAAGVLYISDDDLTLWNLLSFKGVMYEDIFSYHALVKKRAELCKYMSAINNLEARVRQQVIAKRILPESELLSYATILSEWEQKLPSSSKVQRKAIKSVLRKAISTAYRNQLWHCVNEEEEVVVEANLCVRAAIQEHLKYLHDELAKIDTWMMKCAAEMKAFAGEKLQIGEDK